jgi:hypothetical protein
VSKAKALMNAVSVAKALTCAIRHMRGSGDAL